MRKLIDIISGEAERKPNLLLRLENLQEGIEVEPSDGCWILPDGEIKACDRMNDIHHTNVAADHFGHDESENEYDEADFDEDGEYYGDDDPTDLDAGVFDDAFAAGWIRVGQMGGAAYAQLPQQPTAKSLRVLARVARLYTGYNHYTLERSGSETKHFIDHRAFMVGIARMADQDNRLTESFQPSEYGYWIEPSGMIISCDGITHGEAAAHQLGKVLTDDDEEQEREFVDEAMQEGSIRIVASKGSSEFNAEWNDTSVTHEAKQALLKVFSVYSDRDHFILQNEYFDQARQAIRYIRAH